jgi:hypothetical protein
MVQAEAGTAAEALIQPYQQSKQARHRPCNAMACEDAPSMTCSLRLTNWSMQVLAGHD